MQENIRLQRRQNDLSEQLVLLQRQNNVMLRMMCRFVFTRGAVKHDEIESFVSILNQDKDDYCNLVKSQNEREEKFSAEQNQTKGL